MEGRRVDGRMKERRKKVKNQGSPIRERKQRRRYQDGWEDKNVGLIKDGRKEGWKKEGRKKRGMQKV